MTFEQLKRDIQQSINPIRLTWVGDGDDWVVEIRPPQAETDDYFIETDRAAQIQQRVAKLLQEYVGDTTTLITGVVPMVVVPDKAVEAALQEQMSPVAQAKLLTEAGLSPSKALGYMLDARTGSARELWEQALADDPDFHPVTGDKSKAAAKLAALIFPTLPRKIREAMDHVVGSAAMVHDIAGYLKQAAEWEQNKESKNLLRDLESETKALATKLDAAIKQMEKNDQ